MKTAEMVHEMTFLGAAIKTHRERIAKAWEAEAEAAIAFEEAWGFSPWEAPEYAPGWSAARAKVEALSEETGYFWAVSRYGDLEHLTGSNGGTLPLVSPPASEWASARSWVLRGETPKAHPSVGPWVIGVFNLPVEFSKCSVSNGWPWEAKEAA